MRRRQLSGWFAAMAWPLAAAAQPKPLPVVGWLHPGAPDDVPTEQTAFRRGLADQGFLEGRDLSIEYRWARGHYDLLPALAADLVARQPAVIFSGPLNSTVAAKAATSSIPIVFNVGVDPVAFGLIASFNRPGGNLTGVAEQLGELWPKRLQLLHEVMPKATTVGVLVNPRNPNTKTNLEGLDAAARPLGLSLMILPANTKSDAEAAVASIPQRGIETLFVGDDPFFRSLSGQLAVLTARHRVAAISFDRPFAAAGGLISFGPSFDTMYGKAGGYVGRILKGARPAEMPVEQAVKFELVVNLKAAQALGLALPPTLLGRADEVLE